jgi:hypothetical protein
MFEKLRIMPKNRALRTCVEMSFFFTELYCAVPLAIAMYPVNGIIEAKDVEPHIREWKNQQGESLKEF